MAPMDGITDPPYRTLIREMGSAMTISEFINTLDLQYRKDVMLRKLAFQEPERPYSVQLLDNDAHRLAESAKLVYDKLQPDIIDINFGCPDSRVVNRGAGSALMNNPDLVREIIHEVKSAVPTPVTGKIRLGWAHDSQNYMEIAHIIQEEGAAAIAIHGRTRKQGYSGHAHWEPIAELKSTLRIPVIGNGDVVTVEDITRMKVQTGCDAVMIGRAAISNPWIFSLRNRDEVPAEEVHAFILKQLSGILAHNETFAGLRRFRKFAKAYLQPYGVERDTMHNLMTIIDPDEFRSLLDEIFQGIN